MASTRISALFIFFALAIGLGLALASAQLSASPFGASETSSQSDTQTERGSQSPETRVERPSEADVGISAMMQMLRNEGIDIDARMAQARSGCRDKVMAEAGGTSTEEIEQAVNECALVEEGVIYARAINEMNANRVNTFNDSMAQYNSEVAEADRQQREYELEMQGHSAEVAEIQRQQQQYERDMAAHEQLLAGRSGRARSSAGNTSSDNSAADMAALPADPPVRTASAGAAASPPQETTRPSASTPSRPLATNTGNLAASTAPATTQQATGAPPAGNSPALARGAGGQPAQGRMLSQTVGPSSQGEVELAIMEATGPRIALIIGNEAYDGSMGSLANPVNDAVLIGATLRSVGFDVEVLTNASQREMREAVRRLGDRLATAGDNATGLFYYAGHGVQSQGNNFLIPVGSVVDSESDLQLEAVNADAILAQMEEAYVSTRIVILDACRNMPLRRRSRNGARGLARMETPNGSFVAYSTSPGSTAADGGGIHSPFAEALATQMLVPDRPIEVTFREVRRQVVELTGGDQVPWDSSSLLDTFSFSKTR